MNPIHTLCDLLAQENDALAAFDLKSATALVAEKQLAIDAVLTVPAAPVAREDAARLKQLILENKRLLERAMVVQDRVLGCIARAMPRAMGQEGRYGANGASRTARALPPMALSARA
jgi:hypothetical protein